MQVALELAAQAASTGEVPVGAIAVKDGVVIGRGYNRREIDADPFSHAEFTAMQAAARAVGAWRLTGVTVYVTLEPCVMVAFGVSFTVGLTFGSIPAQRAAQQDPVVCLRYE